MDICQAFLHQSEDGKLHIAWQSSNIGGNIQRDGYVTAFCQPLYIHVKGGRETAFVQQRRMQKVRGSAYFAV